MNSHQYEAARKTLAWTHAQAGKALGKSERMMYRYAAGREMPTGQARLLRALVLLRLCSNDRKFEEMLREIMK